MISASHGSAQEMCKKENAPFGSCAADGDWESARFFPPAGDGFGPQFGVGPSAERQHGIKKTDQVRRLKSARHRKFESISLQRGVSCEPKLPRSDRQSGLTGGVRWAAVEH